MIVAQAEHGCSLTPRLGVALPWGVLLADTPRAGGYGGGVKVEQQRVLYLSPVTQDIRSSSKRADQSRAVLLWHT